MSWKVRSLVMAGLVAGMGVSVIHGEDAAGGGAAAPSPVLPVMVKAREAMVIDGKLDEPDWKRATEIPVNGIWGKKGKRTESPRMTAKYLWDDFYLYIGYEVFDTNLVVKSSGASQGPADNRREGMEIWVKPPAPQVDLAEFFIVFDDPNCFWETHHNAANQFNDVLCIVDLPAWKKTKSAMAQWNIYFGKEEYIQDHEGSTLAKAVALKPRADGSLSTVNDGSDQDTGYTGEIRIPWFGIGAPAAAMTWVPVPAKPDGTPAGRKAGPWKMAGRELSILAVSQDGDPADRYCSSAPDMYAPFFHLGSAGYPRYRLVEE